MAQKLLTEGDTIYIKRTNGALRNAIVTVIDHNSMCVKVEWFEDEETKGKEIHFNNVLSLNPDISIIKPVATVAVGPNKSLDKWQRHDNDKRKNTDIRVQSAKTRYTQSHLENNFSDQLRIEGIGFSSARITKSVIETQSKHKDKGTLKRVSKLEQDRLVRRKNQAAAKAEKTELIRKNQNNPHWELTNMIRQFRRQIEFKPLSSQDTIEDHLITVAVRKRPLNAIEISKKEIDIITVPSKNQIIVHEPKHKVDLTKYLENHMYRFDYTLNETSSNQMVYKYTAQPLIKTVFNGGFATCFAYGQTGSGKTYTMSGNLHSDSDKGIYALTASDIFKSAKSAKYRHKFIISCSFFEIYVKKVFDLLNNKAALKILEDELQQVHVVGLTEKIVTSEDEVLNLVLQGNKERASGQTSANSQSSRSHAIFQFYIRNQLNPNSVYGKFSLIDLAGNERGADTFSFSKTTRLEGSEINQSLLSLKECIRALGRKDAHLPFRGSKLTQVLRDSFVGNNSKTCMIAMISPGVGSCENTLNTLRYADRVKELGDGNSIQKLDRNAKDARNNSKTCMIAMISPGVGSCENTLNTLRYADRVKELGDGNSIQKLDRNAKDASRTFGTQCALTNSIQPAAEEPKSRKDEKLLKHNTDLITILQKYTKQAQSLLEVKDADDDTYYINMNIVVTDAISELIKIKNLILYFVVLQ
ncbi:kinesin-like protein Klp10A [Dendroctonus ponderosae]|uniref:Kinesin-like protein n=1 Tax=Dendroctonus ponderosae TaxID=77166 RepID=U4U8Q7_DENPD|nr:kinesin-like protein Klp10A [Dendroctonus ponderosae]ERL90304.1 hypothetical protein D910_07655 [Dendroctonus ponderosae]KAH1024010.1 hypothetical protein HUJ05_003577 [Dendroctonus ponderosae]